MGRAYYNENDPAAAAILREQIRLGVIAPGDVDERSIKEVTADDIRGYVQCHWFAGGGLWSVAARMGGWPDARSLWSASCPCQPWSAAGQQAAHDDPRHLWPDLFRICRAACRAGFGPPVLVGEQVASSLGYNWFDGVRADLASEAFAARTVDFPAGAVDAPHRRNRQYWIAVADDESGRRGAGLREDRSIEDGAAQRADGRDGGYGDVADADLTVVQRQPSARQQRLNESHVGARGRNGTYWSDAEWIICHDGKARRAQPGIRLLVNGLPGRVDLWRVGGNAIVPQVAAEVIAAFLEAEALNLARAA